MKIGAIGIRTKIIVGDAATWYLVKKYVDGKVGGGLEFSHANLTDKNSEAAFQHVNTTVTKETLDEADKVALYDSVTGKVVLSNALNDIETILASI